MIRILHLINTTGPMSDEQVHYILATAHRNNSRTGVTGVLIHMGGLFAQILGGPERAVLRLYVKILEDRRHSDCRIIQISPTKIVNYIEWHFALR